MSMGKEREGEERGRGERGRGERERRERERGRERGGRGRGNEKQRGSIQGMEKKSYRNMVRVDTSSFLRCVVSTVCVMHNLFDEE